MQGQLAVKLAQATEQLFCFCPARRDDVACDRKTAIGYGRRFKGDSVSTDAVFTPKDRPGFWLQLPHGIRQKIQVLRFVWRFQQHERRGCPRAQHLLQCVMQTGLCVTEDVFVFFREIWLCKQFLIAFGIRNQVTPCKFRNGQS